MSVMENQEFFDDGSDLEAIPYFDDCPDSDPADGQVYYASVVAYVGVIDWAAYVGRNLEADEDNNAISAAMHGRKLPEDIARQIFSDKVFKSMRYRE